MALLEDFDEQMLNNLFDVNLNGVFRVTKAVEYGNLFNMHSNFEAMVAQQIEDGTVNNPQMVADAVVQRIETPKGQRPFRTVIDAMFKQMLDPYNNMLDDIQQNLLSNFGIGDLTQPNT